MVLVLVGGVEYSNRQHEKNVEIDAEPEREVFKRRYDEYYGIVGAFDKFDKQEKIKEEQRYGTPEDRKWHLFLEVKKLSPLVFDNLQRMKT